MTLNPIAGGHSLNERLSVQMPPRGETLCAATGTDAWAAAAATKQTSPKERRMFLVSTLTRHSISKPCSSNQNCWCAARNRIRGSCLYDRIALTNGRLAVDSYRRATAGHDATHVRDRAR